ncbi:MAG TPA: Uma2 family endonuclease [Hymenobacter sp.]|jgi:Uma2 family endonuclease
MTPITQLSQLDPNGSYTYADYLTWKFEEYVELIRGKVLRHMAGPSPVHQQCAAAFVGGIYPFLKGKACRVYPAPFDVRLMRSNGNGDAQIQTVVQPDVCVVCDLAKIDARGCVGAPDWIIEILSPGNLAHDTRTKFDLYEESGVREYWIVAPGLQSVTAYVLDAAGRYQVAAEYAAAGPMLSATLPGLAIEWADVFDDV